MVSTLDPVSRFIFQSFNKKIIKKIRCCISQQESMLINLHGIVSISLRNLFLIFSKMSSMEEPPDSVELSAVVERAGAIVMVLGGCVPPKPVGSGPTMASGFFLKRFHFMI